MDNRESPLYLAQEFAERAGVTVRTLHHYDRTGLLKPSGYTAAGYRLYGEKDLARLQQIVTLKFIGFSLRQIKELLEQREFDLTATLRLQ
ncbi:MAG TPA: MerR family transcriptional regulator, partial [Pyrinomonadaceae bacterium]|nr:MerR family transcriptional regulator [Pyrinomonadaceae bacterium]